MYELKNITRLFKDQKVLEIPDLSIPGGEITAFVGPNGAGKSTLLSLIAFLQRPEIGSIRFQGRKVRYDRNHLRDIRLKVTLVHQHPFVFRGSVFSNVTYGLRVRGVSHTEWESRAEEALERVGLDGFEGRHARSLSGGEMQRLALARAVILKPLVLLLDEPTAHVDSSRTASIESLIKQLHKELDLTVVLATHDMNQASNLTGRIVSLESGHIKNE